jgi:hypothetical protein
MRRVRVVPSAMRDLDRLRASSAEIDEIRTHLRHLASSKTPGFDVPFDATRDILYSDVGRVRVLFKLVGDELAVVEFGLVA